MDPNILANMTPEAQAEAAAILHKRRIIERRMANGGAFAGRFQPSLDQANEQLTGLVRRNEADYNQAVQGYMAKRMGQPEIAPPAAELGGGPGRPETVADPKAAILEAMLSRHPQLRGLVAKENEPFTLNAGDRRFVGGAEVAANPAESIKAIPPTWKTSLPPGAKRSAADPAGIFRMSGADGNLDVYSMEFDRGKLSGYKRLDNNFREGAGASGRSNPFMSPVSTAGGVYSFDHRTGKMELVADAAGKPIVRETADPVLQRDIAGGKAEGKAVGDAGGKGQISLPRELQQAENAIGLVDQMIGSEDKKIKKHPGFDSAVGWTWTPGLRLVHGSKEANFMALLDQIKGQAFIESFEKLKGGGAITEIEGIKATQALTRMQHAQSEKDFVTAAREFQRNLRQGMSQAKQRAARTTVKPAAGPSVESLLELYK